MCIDSMQILHPFIKGTETSVVWYLWGNLNQSPMDTEESLKIRSSVFLQKAKSYV
jgi:hypothetical protein